MTTNKQPQAEAVSWGIDWGKHGDKTCVSIIKKHADGTMEVVATEYEPEANVTRKAPQQAEAVPQAAVFCWLVEHFDGDGTGNSTGHYYTGELGIADRVLTTMEASQAKRYDTWREANLASAKLGSTMNGTWRAVQHGFHTMPQQAEAVPTVQVVNCDTCKHSANSCDDYPCNRCGVEFGDGPFNRWEAPQQAEAVQYTRADLDRAYSAGLVEGERLAIQQAEAVPLLTDESRRIARLQALSEQVHSHSSVYERKRSQP